MCVKRQGWFRQIFVPNRQSAAILLLLAIVSATLQAREPEESTDLTSIPLEELGMLKVYTASKFAQKISEAPSSVSIITADEIERHDYQTLDDILRSVTGFNISYDRNYSYVGTRGFGLIGDYNARFLILIDGHRLNDILYESAGTGTDFPINVDLIERVEIVRGPGSSLYGANAFFGVMNVITKSGGDLNGARLTVRAAGRDTYSGSVSYGEKFNNGFEVLFSGMYGNSKGNRRLYYPEFDSPETNNGIVQDADADRYGAFLAKLAYKDLSVQLVMNRRDKAVPTASFDTYFGDRNTHTDDTRAFFVLQYQRSYNDSWNIMARSYFDVYEDNSLYTYDYSEDETPYLISNIDLNHAYWWGGETQVMRTFDGKHHLTAGVDWRNAFRAKMRNYDEYPDYYPYLDIRENPTNYGVYLQGELELRPGLIVNAGLRYDNYSTFGGTANPRMALIYSPLSKTTFKFLHGYAFRPPNLYELYYNDIQSKANPDLQPEKIGTTEIQVEQYLGHRFRITGSAYHNEITQFVEWGLDPADELRVFTNSGEIHSNGIEIELEGKNIFGIDGRLGYAVQRTTDRETFAVPSNSPQHIAQLNLTVPVVSNRCWAGLDMRYVSARRTLTGNTAGGYFLANLSLLYRNLLPDMDLRAGLTNIFDRRYADPGGGEHRQDTLPQDGRSFRIGLVYRFADSLFSR
jgi:outer membrane receptor for ferrienterochelin and colicins